ncbi:cleavage and polyadenylation specificity factor subunit 6-like isoform X2 [Passer montanus]|uniref:cleavage and polyadenylation specificity factor subunit 6-like isoform X2 n=1 Tax=Passer montanus TaxID=9160 RepID=UPI00195F6091|nr:cleavage and polyadenylation specificity factor subunit 6-like isoform X2 [Passer montanus]
MGMTAMGKRAGSREPGAAPGLRRLPGRAVPGYARVRRPPRPWERCPRRPRAEAGRERPFGHRPRRGRPPSPSVPGRPLKAQQGRPGQRRPERPPREKAQLLQKCCGWKGPLEIIPTDSPRAGPAGAGDTGTRPGMSPVV